MRIKNGLIIYGIPVKLTFEEAVKYIMHSEPYDHT